VNEGGSEISADPGADARDRRATLSVFSDAAFATVELQKNRIELIFVWPGFSDFYLFYLFPSIGVSPFAEQSHRPILQILFVLRRL